MLVTIIGNVLIFSTFCVIILLILNIIAFSIFKRIDIANIILQFLIVAEIIFSASFVLLILSSI